MNRTYRSLLIGAAAIALNGSRVPTFGQVSRAIDSTARSTVAAPAGTSVGGAAPDAYRIGPEDVLDISVWKSADLTRTVAVRPDGKISLPLLNDIQAANMTPMQLRDALAKGYAEYVSAPEVSVI